MSQAKSKAADPSIDDMLNSIREAIHEETAREVQDAKPAPPPKAASRKPAPRKQVAQKPAAPRQPARKVPPPRPAERAPTMVAPEQSRARGTSVSGSMRELRVSLQPARSSQSPGMITARSEDFLSLKNKLASLTQQPSFSVGSSTVGPIAGVMGGDTRVDEAVNRLNTAEQLQRANNPPPPPPAAVQPAPPPDNEPPPMMRAAVDETLPDPIQVEPVTVEAVNVEPANVEPVVETQQAPAEVVQAAPVVSEPVAEATAEPEAVVVEPSVITPAPIKAAAPAPVEAGPMMSSDAASAAAKAFEHLAEQLFRETDEGQRILQDTASDMIRPMLKKWLDDNLPSLVERLVREEIERVARKGGR